MPPRPMLWDQIDNSLLIRQNETYRRRLAATRWVAAASLLLATLAGTGWWAKRDASLGGNNVAVVSRPADARTSDSAMSETTLPAINERHASVSGRQSTQALATATSPATSATTPANDGLNGSAANRKTTTNASYSVTRPMVAANSATRNARNRVSVISSGLTDGLVTAQGTRRANRWVVGEMSSVSSAALAARTAQSSTTGSTDLAGPTGSAGRVFGATETADAPASVTVAKNALTSAADTPALDTTVPESLGTLAARSAALNLTDAAALPNGLATLSLPADAEPLPGAVAHKWRYGASYTAGVFNPNINFSRTGIASKYGYNPALGAGSPALTEAAAAQYRENLRPGLSQRIALLATRHLKGHWSVSTGAQFTQATAKSASASAFVGEQILDLGQSSTGPLRTTNFRYRMAGIPVEVSYSNPVKRGWSFYGRLGSVVSALLGVRSEVEGSPEATRTYSFMSAGAPYRRLLASVRGGAGAQYRPSTGSWAFKLGPVAEMDLVPLNAHPAQSYLAQSRAYGFGLEMGVEFGK